MPIVRPCATEGCETLTMGEFCLACEQDREDVFQGLRREIDAAADAALSPEPLPPPAVA